MTVLSTPIRVPGIGRAALLSRATLAFCFLISLWAVFGHLGDFVLLSPDEGRNAEVAREMGASGAWLVPTYLGAAYLDKPAFFFRAVALSMELFGVTEWAARLPSALFGFGLLMALFAFCRRAYDERTAALGLLIVAATPLFMAFARIVIFDMTLGFFVCSAIFAAYLAEEYEGSQRTRWYLLAAAAGGFATLVKGPVGFLVPLLVMAAFHGTLRDTAALRRLFAPSHWLIFLALVLPWFVGLSLARPDFPYYGIMRESVARFTTPVFRRTEPFYFYGLIIAGGFFSWSLLLPESIAVAWRRRGQLSRPDRLFIVWAVVVVAFFSLSKSKMPGYILTGVVALGVLTARVFASALHNPEGTAARVVRRGTAALLALAAPTTLAMTAIALKPEWLGARLRFKPEVFERFVPLFPTVALSLAGVALLAALAWRRRDQRLSFAAFLLAPLLPVTADFELLPRFAEARSGHSLAAAIPKSLPPDTELACLKCLPHGLPFYRQQLLTVFSDEGKELTSNYVLYLLGSGQPWPERIVSMAQRDRWLASRNHPVYLMARKDRAVELEAIAASRGVATTELGPDYRAVLLPAPPALSEVR